MRREYFRKPPEMGKDSSMQLLTGAFVSFLQVFCMEVYLDFLPLKTYEENFYSWCFGERRFS